MTRSARTLLALGALGAVALGVAACGPNNIERSRKIGESGKHLIADRGNLKVTTVNPDVKVLRTALVQGNGAVAAAVQLRSSAHRAEAKVPLLINVQGAGGKSVFRNDAVGLQPALQQIALLKPGRTEWWVNDQLLGAEGSKHVTARVGTARTTGAVPRIALREVHLDRDPNGAFLTGIVVNHSKVAQKAMPIFAVGLKGGKVRAAGRAIIDTLPVGRTTRPTRFRIYFVGNPSGAKFAVTVAPTVLSKEAA